MHTGTSILSFTPHIPISAVITLLAISNDLSPPVYTNGIVIPFVTPRFNVITRETQIVHAITVGI